MLGSRVGIGTRPDGVGHVRFVIHTGLAADAEVGDEWNVETSPLHDQNIGGFQVAMDNEGAVLVQVVDTVEQAVYDSFLLSRSEGMFA